MPITAASQSTKTSLTDLLQEFRRDPLLMAGGGAYGCDARALLIVATLQRAGFEAGKIWCWGRNEKVQDFAGLRSRKTSSVGYLFHVAATAKQDGEHLVVDPMYFEKLLTIKDWISRFQTAPTAQKISYFSSPHVQTFNQAVMREFCPTLAAPDAPTAGDEFVARDTLSKLPRPKP